MICLLFLFDIQLALLTALSGNVTFAVGALVEGVNSGARGYTQTANNNHPVLNLIQTNGTFLVGEKVRINDVELNVTILGLQEYGAEDIKSIVQSNSTGGSGHHGGDAITNVFSETKSGRK